MKIIANLICAIPENLYNEGMFISFLNICAAFSKASARERSPTEQ